MIARTVDTTARQSSLVMKGLVDQLLEGQCCDAAKALCSKTGKTEAVEDFSGLSPKVLKRISTAMAEKAATALEQLSEGDTPDQDENMPDKRAIADAEAYIKSCAIVLRSFIEIRDENMPEEVEQLILDLCAEAMLGFPTRESMQDAIARLGLDYLCSGAPNRLGVPSLLWKVLHPDAKAADAKRLNQAASAGAFQILDFEREQSTDTLEMILRTSMHPIMLQTAEGRRCIATFLDLGPVLAGSLLGTMRAQIQMGKAMVLDAYGEILYKAWQNCSEENRDYIEQDIIQELMNSAILARTTQLHTNLERMLSCLHEQKDAKEMLQRLYQPILWPALAAPNADVRRNAVNILLSAFPITDGKSGDKEALEAAITMQVTKIANAMRDTDPSIRKLAAGGACGLLLKYWELLAQFSGQLIGKLMALLKYSAFDAESPKTRVAVLEGLGSLVQNPLAQSAVAITFQDLKPLLYDSSRSVRRAMVEFIQQVASIKTLKWWESFPPAELVSIMGSDNKDVAEIIHSMLFTQYVEADELTLQACAGLVQLLRDSSSAGAAFCRTMAERAISGDNENITVQSIGAFAVDLADYLASCAIKATPAKSKAKTAVVDAGSDKEVEAQATQTGSKRGKRPRVEEDDVYGEWETQESWTAIICGLKELVVPVYEHCRQQIETAAEVAEASTSKKKGRRGGGAKQKVTCKAAAEAENLLQSTFPAEMLVVLLKNAPSTHGVQEVFSIGVATHMSDAAISLAEYCLGQVQTGCIELPNLRKKTGGKLASVNLASITRQEHLPAEQCRLASALCVMMDLLVKCEGSELLRVLRKGLLTSPDLPQAAGSAKRTRKAGGKKVAKGKASVESTLDVNGTMAMLPMLFRDGADIRCIGTDGMSELLEMLGGAAAEVTAKLSSSQPVAKSILADAILTTNCFYNMSAVAASQDVAIDTDVVEACKAHVERMREHVLHNLDDIEEPIDLEDTCSQLFAFLSDLNGEPGNRVKRARALESEWRTTNQQGAMLLILGHCTVDLAVGANTAMDKYEELLVRSEEEDESVTETDLDEAEGKAVAACMNAWSAGQSLMERHAAFVADLLPDPTMRQLLWMSTVECIPAVRSSLEAVLRGLSASRLPGDFPYLMSLVGVHLAIAQAVSNMDTSKATLKHRLNDLVYVVLNGCSILAPDSSEPHGQRRASAGTTPIPSPLQGLNVAQQQEYIPQLLQATFGVLGLLRIQSASNDKESLVDVSLAAGWLFSGIAALTTTVAFDVRNALRQHMKEYLKNSADEETSFTGCKMLLAALGDG